MSDLQNPRNWRYTWETLAHVPTLRLFLFHPQIKPAIHCKNLIVTLKFEESLIQVRWNEEMEHRSSSDVCVDSLLRVPVPRVLIEVGSPVDFKVTDDHIEVKLVLLLPIDHPLVSNFDSVLNLSDEDPSRTTESFDGFRPLSVGSDIKHMLAADGINFYCRSCSTKLTKKPLRSFVEIPSVDWREAADNWFGTCCCSFGGISEKLVTKYVSSYACAEGTCLYDATSVIVSKDDLAGCVFPDSIDGNENIGNGPDRVGEVKLTEAATDSESNCGVSLCRLSLSETTSDADKCLSSDSSLLLKSENIAANHEVIEEQRDIDSSFCPAPLVSDISVCDSPHGHKDNKDHVPSQVHECCSHDVSVTSSKDQDETNKLLRDHESLLSGSLGSGFMVRTSNISEGVKWIDFRCSQCSYILGAYPSATDEYAPLDGGIRFLKCYISSNLPVSGSGDIFRKYSLQRMFANQLIQNADDELSFRTVVKDLKTNYPMLQLVLLNSNSWYCSGYCSEEEGVKRPLPKVDLRPVIKVLYCESDDASESQSRMIEEWASKNQAGEVYMLNHQITELIESLKSAQDRLPFSCSFMQGLTLSFLER